jgi:hypothetical protein
LESEIRGFASDAIGLGFLPGYISSRHGVVDCIYPLAIIEAEEFYRFDLFAERDPLL